MPAAVIDRLIALGDRARFVRGNADRHLVSTFDQGQRLADVQYEKDPWLRRAAWKAEQISREQRDFLASLPENAVLEVGGLGETLFCHGSPRSDEEIITPGTTEERLSVMLAGVNQPAVVCGHTHMQLNRRHGQTRIVNAGSVGMPYEGQPGAYWACSAQTSTCGERTTISMPLQTQSERAAFRNQRGTSLTCSSSSRDATKSPNSSSSRRSARERLRHRRNRRPRQLAIGGGRSHISETPGKMPPLSILAL
jgi:diadenosine tetraphosphatase ApaH/serine/threonine PP2A family protein phosphatase